MKHTQGKWENDNTGKYYNGHWIRMNGVLIAKISHQKGGKSKGEPEANARLIAAAPDLLEKLKDYIEWHESAIPKNHRDDYEKEYLIEGSKFLIAKAEGK